MGELWHCRRRQFAQLSLAADKYSRQSAIPPVDHSCVKQESPSRNAGTRFTNVCKKINSRTRINVLMIIAFPHRPFLRKAGISFPQRGNPLYQCL